MNRLRKLRKEKKLTQEYLAKKLGVSKLSISRWERGIHQIQLDKAEMLCSIFGVSLTYLLGIDGVTEQNLPVYKQCMLELNNILINLIRDADKLTYYNLGNIKSEAIKLYETIVCLQNETVR